MKEMIKQAAFTCCKLYISESRNAQALEAIERAAKAHSHVHLLNIFDDKEYNRVGYTLASSVEHEASVSSPPLQRAVLGMVKTALEVINLEGHCGTHPRLGVVDHICFHPLGESSNLNQAALLARSVAAQIGASLKVPTFLYGAAHRENRTLDWIRRELGYFTPNCEGQWVGLASIALGLAPDYGPSQVFSRSGVVVVGACPWVVNYNVPICSSDIVAGRRIARKLSARGGGLPGVQAMALLHGDKGMEIACNLLDAKNVGPHKVQEEVTLLAEKEGLRAKKGYLTDFSEDQILEAFLHKLKVVKGDK